MEIIFIGFMILVIGGSICAYGTTTFSFNIFSLGIAVLVLGIAIIMFSNYKGDKYETFIKDMTPKKTDISLCRENTLCKQLMVDLNRQRVLVNQVITVEMNLYNARM